MSNAKASSLREYSRYIFTDIDGCLIDGNSLFGDRDRFTAPLEDVAAVIRELNNEGIGFGLNSGRSQEGIIDIARVIEEDMGIVGEYGSLIGRFQKQGGLEITEELCGKVQLPEGLKETAHIDVKRGISGNGAFYEKGRYYSACIYCLKNGLPDSLLAEKIKGELDFLNPLHKVFISKEFMVWCLPKRTDKGVGIKRFGELHACRIGMIGHDDYDAEALFESELAMAPKNQIITKDKVRLDYISKMPYTSGVIDCMRWAAHNMGLCKNGRYDY